MIIAHLPAGYLLSKALQRRLKTGDAVWAGLLASIFPDFDILYFYLLDSGQTSHRQYWTHLPAFWLVVGLGVWLLTRGKSNGQRQNRLYHIRTLFFTNIALHLCLDTVIAPVYWLQPFTSQGIRLFTLHIERTYTFWLWNYMLHPIFILEILICAAGFCLWVHQNWGRLRVIGSGGWAIY